MRQNNSEDWFDETKPTFLFKINVGGLSRQRADEQISKLKENYKSVNCNSIWLPLGSMDENAQSNVECIHGGSSNVESKFMERMIENTLNLDEKVIEEAKLSGKFNDEQLLELKSIIRRNKIKSLLGES